jgi:hypothetical protein
LANDPDPLLVHKIVPLLELAPLTVAVPVWQIVCEPPATAVGEKFTVTVTLLLRPVKEQPFASVTDVNVYVVVEAGVTLKLDPLV